MPVAASARNRVSGEADFRGERAPVDPDVVVEVVRHLRQHLTVIGPRLADPDGAHEAGRRPWADSVCVGSSEK